MQFLDESENQTVVASLSQAHTMRRQTQKIVYNLQDLASELESFGQRTLKKTSAKIETKFQDLDSQISTVERAVGKLLKRRANAPGKAIAESVNSAFQQQLTQMQMQM